MNMIILTPLDLSIAAVLVLSMAGLTIPLRVGIGKQIVIAACRAGIQLMLLGFVLRFLFSNIHPIWVLVMSLIMLLAGGREIVARQQRRFRGGWGYGIGGFSMFISSFLITLLALTVIVSPQPWYHPQYAIPLLGMLLGNTMNGISLGLDRMTQTAWQQRAIIEQRLMLGQSSNVAISDIRRQSIRSGLTPIINSMATAGIVSLPGMMTGQILAGSPPFEAIKYQIVIMFLIATGTGLGIIFSLQLTCMRLFDDRHRLRLDRLVPP